MKVKILSVLLFLSLGFNIAGIVSLVCLIDLRGDYKALKREKNSIVHNLALLRASAAVPDDANPADRIEKRTFVSHFDGSLETYAVLPPVWRSGKRNYTLVVYLHGMGSTMLEPFIAPDSATIASSLLGVEPDTCLLSCNYRGKASWGNDAALSDVTQNIRAVMNEYPVGNIVIAGTSMGGCTALNYAATCPADVRKRIAGVISVEGAGDLLELYRTTSMDIARYAMQAAFGGSPDKVAQVYNRKSFLSNVDSLPQGGRIAVVSAKDDTTVPAALQRKVVEALEERSYPVKLLEVEGGHAMPPGSIYAQAYAFVLGRS